MGLTGPTPPRRPTGLPLAWRLAWRLAWLPCLAPSSAGAGALPGDTHAAIAAERQALVDRYAAEESECRRHFVVTSCLEDVRLRRRDALAPLREREMALSDRERLQRAADRKAALAARREAESQRPPAPAAVQAQVRMPPVARTGAPFNPALAEAARASAAQQRRQAAQERTEAAQSTKDRVARRLADRAQQGKPVTPLPVPDAASTARP